MTASDATVVETVTYDPYGEATVTVAGGQSASGNPYLFQGRRWDGEADLYYFRNRSLSPRLGRFVQRDPVGYVDGMNVYEALASNPARYADPAGLGIGDWIPDYFKGEEGWFPDYFQGREGIIPDYAQGRGRAVREKIKTVTGIHSETRRQFTYVSSVEEVARAALDKNAGTLRFSGDLLALIKNHKTSIAFQKWAAERAVAELSPMIGRVLRRATRKPGRWHHLPVDIEVRKQLTYDSYRGSLRNIREGLRSGKVGRVSKGAQGLTSTAFWLLHRAAGTAFFEGSVSACYNRANRQYTYKSTITRSFLIKDTLDFIAASGRSTEYNFWANTVGAGYHRVLGARQAPVEVRWKAKRIVTVHMPVVDSD